MFILRCCSTMSSISFIVMIISQPHALRENVPTGSTCSSVSHGNGSGRPVRKNTSWLIGQSAKTSKALHFHRPIQKSWLIHFRLSGAWTSTVSSAAPCRTTVRHVLARWVASPAELIRNFTKMIRASTTWKTLAFQVKRDAPLWSCTELWSTWMFSTVQMIDAARVKLPSSRRNERRYSASSIAISCTMSASKTASVAAYRLTRNYIFVTSKAALINLICMWRAATFAVHWPSIRSPKCAFCPAKIALLFRIRTPPPCQDPAISTLKSCASTHVITPQVPPVGLARQFWNFQSSLNGKSLTTWNWFSEQWSERFGDARRRHFAAVRRRPPAWHSDRVPALPQLTSVIRLPDGNYRSFAGRMSGRMSASDQLPVPLGHVQRPVPRVPTGPLRPTRRPLDLRPRLRLLRESHR